MPVYGGGHLDCRAELDAHGAEGDGDGVAVGEHEAARSVDDEADARVLEAGHPVDLVRKVEEGLGSG